MDKDTVKDLTLMLMLMYLTSWEERLVPDLHEKHDRPGFRLQIRRTWKGYDFGILNELTDEGWSMPGTEASPPLSLMRAWQRPWNC